MEGTPTLRRRRHEGAGHGPFGRRTGPHGGAHHGPRRRIRPGECPFRQRRFDIAGWWNPMFDWPQSLRRAEGQSIDPVPKLRHCIGNIMNGVIFGRHYAEDDATWLWLQDLLDRGVKHVAVAGPLNFLPVLRWSPFALSLFAQSLNSARHKKNKTTSYRLLPSFTSFS